MNAPGPIEGPRLVLVPFDEGLRDAFLRGQLEAALGAHRPEDWDGRIGMIEAWSEAPSGHAVWTGWGAWLGLLDGVWVAYANFYGPPADGEVEIGFEVAPGYRRRGLATELVQVLCGWAFDAGAQVVRAEVERSNRSSSGVLERCGFSLVSSKDMEEATKRQYCIRVGASS